VLPSENDDVIVSPYNTSLALNSLMGHADCILPVDNQALFEIVANVEDSFQKAKKKTIGIKEGSTITDSTSSKGPAKKGREYHKENTIVANMLSNLTCSMRYEGSLNVDLNEITMNLVPFPEMKLLLSSLSPLYSILDKGIIPRGITQMFDDAISKNFQMLSVGKNPSELMYLACGMIARGNLGISDLNSNVERLKKKIKMPYWNTEGYKIGLCSQASLGQDYSLLFLSNNSGVSNVMQRIYNSFMKLYKKKMYTCHFTKFGLEESHFDEVKTNISSLIESYNQCSEWEYPPEKSPEEDDGIFSYHIL